MAQHKKPQKNSLLHEVDLIIGSPHDQDNAEIEARIGSFHGTRFISRVEPKDFYRVLLYFLIRVNNGYKYVVHEVVERTIQMLGSPEGVSMLPNVIAEATFELSGNTKYAQRIRESFVDIPGKPTPRFYSTKRRINDVDIRNWYTRFSVSKEQDLGVVADPAVDKSPIPQGMSPQSFRVKSRWSFAVEDQTQTDHPLFPYRVDMTHVSGWYIGRDGKQIPVNSHEIELEVIHKPVHSTQKDLWQGVTFMLELLQNSPYPIPASGVYSVINSFNTIFKEDIDTLEWKNKQKNPRWTFNRQHRLLNVVNKPINLELSALDTGNLISITDKADGERRLMLIRDDGAYLLYPPADISKYLVLPNEAHKDSKSIITAENAKALHNTVLDGELVTRVDGTKEYLAFDMLVNRGYDFRSVKFSERLSRLLELFAKHPVPISIKHFETPEAGNFYHRINTLLDSIPDKPYGNDGLIFNTVMDTYSKGIVYKWKPPHLLTIDFRLLSMKDVNGGNPTAFELWLKGERGQDQVQFLGTSRYPFNGVITVDPPELAGFPLRTGQIVEMQWQQDSSTFIPLRIRHDRDQPNKISTAVSVWNDIMRPITEQTIRGRDLVMMRKYHNDIKRKLLGDCKGVIVDIGSGRGGDLHKWKSLGAEILAVEPSEDHLSEFHSRLLESGYKPLSKQEKGLEAYSYQYKGNGVKTTVTLMQGFGQESDRIFKVYQQELHKGAKSADCLAIFNALTFFFDKEESLIALIKTIDTLLAEGGKFMGMVMDGEAVRNMLIKHSVIKKKLASLKPDQYYNLDTHSAINEKSFKNKQVNTKWRLVANDKTTIDGMVAELSKPDPKEVKEYGWSMERTSDFTNDPFGNQIKIHIEDSIVTDQTEYLVDFDELVKRLAAKDIILENTHFIQNDRLSPSQSKLNDLYRVFIFKRTGAPKHVPQTQSQALTTFPITGKQTKNVTDLQQRIRANKRFTEHHQLAKEKAEARNKELREKLAKLKENDEKISPQEGHKIAIELKQLQLDIATATKKLEEKQAAQVELEAQLVAAEQELKKVSKPSQVERPVFSGVPKIGNYAGVVAAKKAAQKHKPVVQPSSKLVIPPPSFPKKVVPKKKPKKIPESELLITEYKIDNTTPFVAIPSPIQSINVEQRAPVLLNGVEFVRIGTVMPTCVLAALLRAVFPSYIFNQNQSGAEPITTTQIERRRLNIRKVQDAVLNQYFKTSFNKGLLPLVSENYPTWKEAKQVLSKCENWPWLGVWDLLGTVCKTNLVVVQVDSPFVKPQITRTTLPFNRTAVVYSYNGEFNTLGQLDANKNLITEFKDKDITIQTLK